MRDAGSNHPDTRRSSLGLKRAIFLSLALLPMAIAASQIFPADSDAAGKFVMRKAELYIRQPTRPPTLLTPGAVFIPTISYEIDDNYFDPDSIYITMNYQWLGLYSYFAELNNYRLTKPFPTDFTATANWTVPPSLFYALDPPVIKVHIDGVYVNLYLGNCSTPPWNRDVWVEVTGEGIADAPEGIRYSCAGWVGRKEPKWDSALLMA